MMGFPPQPQAKSLFLSAGPRAGKTTLLERWRLVLLDYLYALGMRFATLQENDLAIRLFSRPLFQNLPDEFEEARRQYAKRICPRSRLSQGPYRLRRRFQRTRKGEFR